MFYCALAVLAKLVKSIYDGTCVKGAMPTPPISCATLWLSASLPIHIGGWRFKPYPITVTPVAEKCMAGSGGTRRRVGTDTYPKPATSGDTSYRVIDFTGQSPYSRQPLRRR